ncbi:hypothetical protein KSP40_PGU002353 [Platanthera guangdongensis]|uniref:Uncharacterized protein n=1 Tax=Platanthera guangdongensis TaxID=2320717 RepID=A0ABR2LUE2_9ASPA
MNGATVINAEILGSFTAENLACDGDGLATGGDVATGGGDAALAARTMQDAADYTPQVHDPDDDEFETGIKKEQPKGLWDDEDAEDDDIRESWEDDDDATKALKKEPVSDIKKEPKSAKVDSGKKGKADDARTTKTADDFLADPVAEKLRQQR